MKHPFLSILLLALCVGIGLLSILWLSNTILELDQAQQDYQERAAREEKVRLALWRMDSALGPFIAAESMRPYEFYSAFYRASEAVNPFTNGAFIAPVLLPSPLLTFSSEYVKLHFQIDAGETLQSPQVPPEAQRLLAESNYLTISDIERAVARLEELDGQLQYDPLLTALEENQRNDVSVPPGPSSADPTPDIQALSNNAELYSRINQAEIHQSNLPLKIVNKDAGSGRDDVTGAPQPPPDSAGFGGGGGGFGVPGTQGGGAGGFGGGGQGNFLDGGVGVWQGGEDLPQPDVPVQWQAPEGGVEEPIIPIWYADELLLLRRVRIGDETVLQGCWLDWDAVQRWLVGLCADLLPEAQLVAAPGRITEDPRVPGRQLASLPVRLLPGELPPLLDFAASPLRRYLVLAVGAIATATLALTALLWGTLSLSERRARFVSAVTHELRTPLTTFRLYTEMLLEGKVPDGQKHDNYLKTLHAESNRLSHLVENVLSYARLERSRPASRKEVLSVEETLETILPRLQQRAHQSTVEFHTEQIQTDAYVCVDREIVGQILYNLTDNACKYGITDTNQYISLVQRSTSRYVEFCVRDFGVGIRPADVRRIFRPFTKSVQEAARSAPGVGLGLGLSRRLARSQSGRLFLEPVDRGACFVLRLPRHRGKDGNSEATA